MSVLEKILTANSDNLAGRPITADDRWRIERQCEEGRERRRRRRGEKLQADCWHTEKSTEEFPDPAGRLCWRCKKCGAVGDVRELPAAFSYRHPENRPTAPLAASLTILDEAAEIVAGPRRRAYGGPREGLGRIAGLWASYLADRPDARKALDAADVARMMILLKIARDAHRPSRDNLIDIAGYAECLEIVQGGDVRREKNQRGK
jgi:hypothetical protein